MRFLHETKQVQYVYFFLLDSDVGPIVKIGHTWNVKIRSQRIRSQTKKHVQIIATRAFEDSYSAFSAEQMILKKFTAHLAWGNEWFFADPEIVDYASRAFAKEVFCG